MIDWINMENLNVLIYNELYNGGYSVYILNFITILAIFAAISVIITKNPIVSVLFLIGLFVTMAIYLVLIGFGFLGLSYLLVYVGAVSILFLFILMLINVRISELVSDTKNSIPLVFVTAICFNLPVSDYTSNNLSIINTDNNILNVLSSVFKDNTIYIVYSQSWDNNLMTNGHINSIGNVMYSSHNIWLMLVSLILLLSMIGAIVITINYKDYSKSI